MKIYSFDISNLKLTKENIFNIFQKNIKYSTDIQLFTYLVPIEYEMRLDLVSKKIYGTDKYIEELMVINNIINPYSIKQNQEIYYCNENSLDVLHINDDLDDNDEVRQNIIDAAQSSKERSKQKAKIPTTLRPKNIKQITIDTKNRKIKIMNSFK